MKTESTPYISLSQRADEYCLRLGNGQDWCIIADKDSSSWAKKFASVLGLSSCGQSQYPKLIFTRMNSDGKVLNTVVKSLNLNLGLGLPENGWKAKQLKLTKIWNCDDTPDVICEITPQGIYRYDISMIWQALHPVYTRALGAGSLPLHAAMIERDGKGFMLAGQGGTGKSTCSRRLPSSWNTLCDDEALVVRNDKNQYLAHPIPTWSDHLRSRLKKTWNIEQFYPLHAIFFLEKARTDKIVPIGRGEASVLLSEFATESLTWGWRDMSRDEEILLKKKLFNNSCDLARKIPVFTLRVSPLGRFWEEIERAFP